MQTWQSVWTSGSGWREARGATETGTQLVLIFGSPPALRDESIFAALRARHPEARLLGCSTAGEILDTRVSDDTVTATAIRFEKTRLRGASVELTDASQSRAVGAELAARLLGDDLRHVLVLSDGLKVNGSDLVKGFEAGLPRGVGLTGGLAGDGARFAETLVVYDGPGRSGLVAAVGFYGDTLHVGCGSVGGWDSFGPERLITRSSGNVLHELDGHSALSLYKTYLGDYAKDLPASGLLFPLSLSLPHHDAGLVRTILSVNEAEQSMTFAGDVPQGARARFMKANFERLIDGATAAARTSFDSLRAPSADLALLISCVGRKMVLKQRIEEEVESVREILGEQPALTGFYSYGEISPFSPTARCELHNQTMTITTFREAA